MNRHEKFRDTFNDSIPLLDIITAPKPPYPKNASRKLNDPNLINTCPNPYPIPLATHPSQSPLLYSPTTSLPPETAPSVIEALEAPFGTKTSPIVCAL